MGIWDVCRPKDGYAERCLFGHSFSVALEARDQHLSLHFRRDDCDPGRCIHVDGSTSGGEPIKVDGEVLAKKTWLLTWHDSELTREERESA